jgi:hypothetical protein
LPRADDRSWLNTLKGDNAVLSNQIASAHDRIAQLEALVSTLERGGNQPTYPGIDDNYDRQFDEIAGGPSGVPDFSALARTILAGRSDTLPSLAAATTPHPPFDVAMSSIQNFFDTFDASYPFLDQRQVTKDAELIYSRYNDPEYLASGEEDDAAKGKEFILFLLISLGVSENGKADKVSAKSYKDRALVGLSAAIAKEDLVSVSMGSALTSSSACRR